MLFDGLLFPDWNLLILLLSATVPDADHSYALRFKTTRKKKKAENGNMTVRNKNSDYAPLR